jgi:hypothetical protein
MRIAIRTRRLSLRPKLRAAIERYLRRSLNRQRFQLSQVVLYLAPARVYGTEVEIACRLVIWSPGVQQIAVNDADTSIRKVVVRAVRRARHVARRRLKRHIRLRRQFGRHPNSLLSSRFSPADLAS